MKKKVDFFRIAAIVLLLLFAGGVLCQAAVTLVHYFLTEFSPENYYRDDLYIVLISSPVYSGGLLLIPVLCLTIGLLGKKNHILLCLSVGIFAAILLAGISSLLQANITQVISFILFNEHFSIFDLLILFVPALFLPILLGCLWIMVSLLRGKQVPNWFRSVAVFFPALFVLLAGIVLFENIRYFPNFLEVLPYISLCFGLIFAVAAMLEKPETGYRTVTVWIGLLGIGLSLMMLLLGFALALLSLLPGLTEAYFGNLLYQLAEPLCSALFGLGALLTPVAVLRFSNRQKGATPKEESKEEPKASASGSLSSQLSSLKELQAKGLITQADYDAKKQALLLAPLSAKVSLPQALRELKALQEKALIDQADYDRKKRTLLRVPISTTKSMPLPEALRKLKQLQEEGLISEEDYEAKKADLLTQ